MVANMNKAKGEAVAVRDAACLDRRGWARLRRWHTRALVAMGASLLFVGTGYSVATGDIPLWVWLVSGLVSLTGLGIVFRPTHRQPAPVPARSLVWEVRKHGLRMAVGCTGTEAFRVLLAAGQVSEDTTGFILLDSPDCPSESELGRALVRSLDGASCPQHAVARFLHCLDGQCHVEYALVGLWQESRRMLSFFAPGFEAPAAIQGASSRRLDDTAERKTDQGMQTLSFGAHCLSPGERWLFHTPPLVGSRRLWARSFDSTRLLQYACESRAMPNEEWVDHLLQRGFKAHKDSLPTGALLVSVMCEESEDTPADGCPPPVEGRS
ncbi:hypothetical protein LCGC14_1914870 [marine sediment metagenome]|uniref:Uncharacterized protein n=1 Tax=marine sediment metagenome TaxID=412755 RepID=A0A0F9FSE1_9ZZZZ